MPDSSVQDMAPAALRCAPRGTALLLDFDGTLVEIGRTPDAVEISQALADLMARAAAALHGRLAIVSGRSLRQLEALWPLTLPDLVIAGSHGQELKVEGAVNAPAQTGLFTRLAEAALRQLGDWPGVVIEEKTFGLGVHYRLAPHHREAVRGWAAAAAADHDLLVQQGDMVFELRPRGADKGDAVRAIMALDRFAGSTPVFIGDDLTDIPAFEATRALGGLAISVGPRIAAHADEQLADVSAVLDRIGRIAA